jgi:hypothetical protein
VQFDALLPALTARETLTLYARIKGVPERGLAAYVTHLLAQLQLQAFADLPCGGYSGGNKRKLSLGVALIGNPKVVWRGRGVEGSRCGGVEVWRGRGVEGGCCKHANAVLTQLTWRGLSGRAVLWHGPRDRVTE